MTSSNCFINGFGLWRTLMDYRANRGYNAKTKEKPRLPGFLPCAGGVAERPIAPVLKTGDAVRCSRVRISPPPHVQPSDGSRDDQKLLGVHQGPKDIRSR